MRKQQLNRQWTLCHGTSSVMKSLMRSQEQREVVDLPHDAMITMPRSADAPSGAGMAYFHGENLEYSRTFFVSQEEKDRVHYLNFDGIYMNATILINGIFAAKHRCGYTPCTLRIDEFLRYGAENEIQVSIRGSALPNARWYPGEGIYRDVWLLDGEQLHIAPDGLHVMARDCDPELAVLEVETDVRNTGAHPRLARAEISILDGGGREAARRTARFYVKAGDRVMVRQQLELEKPMLWNVDTPALYTCCCRLIEEETVSDSAEASFGIRSLQLDSRRGLRINGESIKLKGGCIHHDNGLLGAVSVPDAEMRRIRLLKEAGYNAIRTAHNPPSTALLDACDKLGMLVMHELTDVWTLTKAPFDYAEYMPQTWEEDVESVVRRDYNHPSIIFWSIGNEIPEVGHPVSAQWGRRLVEKFRALDHTRFITNGINVLLACMPQMKKQGGEGVPSGGINEIMGNISAGGNPMAEIGANPATDSYIEESCDMLDVIGYNYTEDRYEREHALHPNWIFFGSETFSSNLDKNWELVSRNPYVIGDFSWTAWDYLGEVGCGRIEPKNGGQAAFMGDYPWIAASDGDFDLTGYRRPMSYWREIIWGGSGHKPYIAVHRMQNYGKHLYVSKWNMTDAIRCWTWPGWEGKPTTVEVYSDAEEVELLVNGRSLGRKHVGDDFKKFYCKWEAVYEPGEIVAVAYINGLEAGRDLLQTAGASELVLRADRKVLRAGSDDLCYLEIELRDQSGVLDAAAEAYANVRIEGPAILAGCGSADPRTEEGYQSSAHKLYEGRMLAILKAGSEPGRAVITVTSPGRTDAWVELEITGQSKPSAEPEAWTL